MTPRQWDEARRLLGRLQDTIRDTLRAACDAQPADDLAGIVAVTAADTIYRVDRVGEDAILAWFDEHWPAAWPVELVMEGIEDDRPVTFPRDTPVAKTVFKCILDPIDGTRNLMYDKRSAWTLAALAPQRGEQTHLGDVVVAAMTELPTSKQWAADQVSSVRGCGPRGLVAERVNVLDGRRVPLPVRPSQAADFKHGFASLARFFPEGKSLLARVEEDLWDALYGLGSTPSPLVFDDQYISTGGQIYELLVGHDRMLGDLRPLALRKLGYPSALVCHPYDICTSLLLQEAGGVVETPEGEPLRAPLDTTSAVAWMGYANAALAEQVRPVLSRLLKEYFG
jgi:fructose-1,6-bisphosphatase/inositol monophosphatase family enzyme